MAVKVWILDVYQCQCFLFVCSEQENRSRHKTLSYCSFLLVYFYTVENMWKSCRHFKHWLYSHMLTLKSTTMQQRCHNGGAAGC